MTHPTNLQLTREAVKIRSLADADEHDLLGYLTPQHTRTLLAYIEHLIEEKKSLQERLWTATGQLKKAVRTNHDLKQEVRRAKGLKAEAAPAAVPAWPPLGSMSTEERERYFQDIGIAGPF